MPKHIALSVLGQDRPGIVSAITKVLFDTGCNIEDSSMTLLRSEFAMILLVALGKNATEQTLRAKFAKDAGTKGLAVFIKPITSKEDARETQKGEPHIVAVYGADKPGIVYRVSAQLAKKKINITDVQTAFSKGANTYTMLLEATLPKAVSRTMAKTMLTALGKKLGVTISIQPVETPSL
jgi:glycine cleavage system transcriptional repressor